MEFSQVVGPKFEEYEDDGACKSIGSLSKERTKRKENERKKKERKELKKMKRKNPQF